MFTHPSTLTPLLGFVVAIAWAAMRPGAAPALVALACAALLVWTLRRRADAAHATLIAKLARAEERNESNRAALERSEAARSAAEADLRAAEQRTVAALRGSQDGLWEWDLGSNRVDLSPRWKSMLGFETHEIADDRGGWLGRVHSDDRADLEAALDRHLAGSETRFDRDVRLLHKDGSIRHVLSRGVAIRRDDGAPYRMIGLDTDVTQLKRVQTVLDAVAEGTAGTHGEQFFHAMVRHFARALDVDRAFITECADEPVTRVRTLAVWSAKDGETANFEYALAGTPCAEVVGEGRACFHRAGLSRMFPREAGWESFLGMPIIASDGRMLGHLAFFDSRPRGDDLLVDSIYRIFLARAAAEMERSQALWKLALNESGPIPLS
jgi:PAS domain S-box-containing protein